MANYIAYDDKVAGGGTVGTSSNIIYDNTSSGLNADNMQEAIDEVNSKASITETTDNEPYIIRQGKGDLVDLELIGGSVGWNQLIQNGNFVSTSGWNTYGANLSVANNTASVSFIVAGGNVSSPQISMTANHKY